MRGAQEKDRLKLKDIYKTEKLRKMLNQWKYNLRKSCNNGYKVLYKITVIEEKKILSKKIAEMESKQKEQNDMEFCCK